MTFTGVIQTSTARTFNLGKWFWKNKFIILLIFAYIPLIISSINIAQENNYPVGQYLLVQSSLSIINADSVLYEKTILLEENPSKVIGMEKPDGGIWHTTQYYFKTSVFIVSILSLLALITFPFFIFFYFYNMTNTSTKTRSITLALISGIILITFVNLILIIVNLMNGNNFYHIDQSLSFFPKTFQIIKLVLPFHGVFELGKYLVGLI